MIKDKYGAGRCSPLGLFHRFRESEAGRHFRTARREILLGFKAIIEAGIERLDAVEEKDEPQEAHKVEIS